MGIVEVEPAPCQHLHASNYDPATVIPNQPIKVLAGGRLWCFDCKEFFMPRVPPQRYTLKEIEVAASEYLDSEGVDRFREDGKDLTPELLISNLIAWLTKREREGRDGA